MVCVIQSAQRVGQRMHGAQATLKSGRPHGRCHQHLCTCLKIGSISYSLGQKLAHQAYTFYGDTFSHRVIRRGTPGLKTVRQRIHAGGAGQCCGQSHGDDRVEDNDLGHHQGVKNYFFNLSRFIQNDRCPAHLGTSAGSGRHGNNGCDKRCICPGPVITDILQIPQRNTLSRHQRNRLACI